MSPLPRHTLQSALSLLLLLAVLLTPGAVRAADAADEGSATDVEMAAAGQALAKLAAQVDAVLAGDPGAPSPGTLEDLLMRVGIGFESSMDDRRDLLPDTLVLLGRLRLATGKLDEGVGAFLRALEYWAGDRRLELASRRYLDTFRAFAWASVSLDSGLVPTDMLEDVLKLAQTDEDKALAHYLTALALAGDPDLQQRARAGPEFALARKFPLPGIRDALLYHYAGWAESSGFSSYGDAGQLEVEPDYQTAIALYEELAQSGGSLAEAAQTALVRIRQPELWIEVPNTFRPGTQAQVSVRWRNAAQVELTLHSVKLVEAMVPPNGDATDWMRQLQVRKPEPVRLLTLSDGPARPYYPVTQTARFDEMLAPGAYVVIAKAGDMERRDLLLVTEAAVVLKASDAQALVYVANSITGAPLGGADVAVWSRLVGGAGSWTQQTASAGAEGVAVLDLSPVGEQEIIAAASNGDHQAYATLIAPPVENQPGDTRWQLAVYPDKSVYRLGETAHLWGVVRTVSNSAVQVPPATSLAYRITGPGDQVIDSGTFAPDAFGTFWRELPLPHPLPRTVQEQQPRLPPVGTYRLQCFLPGQDDPFYDRPLCRIENELKPDYRITLARSSTGPDDNGLRVGETVRGTVQVDFTYGGAASNVAVQLTVYARGYDAQQIVVPPLFRPDPSNLVSRQTLRTDTRGQAVYSFQTPASTDRDYQYIVEASVVEPSGQLNTSFMRAFATRQDHYVRLNTARRLYEQGQPIRVDLQALSAEGQPEQHSGTLRFLRESWQETWVDRRGREVTGDEIRELRKSSGGWFSFGPSADDYRLKSEGYATEEVATVRLETGADGRLIYEWAPARAGFYRILWVGEGSRGKTVWSERTVWVAGAETEDIGYRSTGIELLANSTRPPPGERVPVLVTVPLPGQHVLVSTGLDTINSWRVLEVSGTSEMLKVTPGAGKPATNLEAIQVADEQMSAARLLLQPQGAREGMHLSIEAENDAYLPGAPVAWTLRVTSTGGKPVVGARVYFCLSDKAALAPSHLARDIANDIPSPRERYTVQTAWTGDGRPYFRPLVDETGSADGTTQATGDTDATQGVEEGFVTPGSAIASATTPVWQPDLVTDAGGTARVALTLPASYTNWRAHAVAVGPDGQLASASINVEARQPVAISLRAPEEAVRDDLFDVHLQVRNNASQARQVIVEAFTEGTALLQQGQPRIAVELPANDTVSLTWRYKATREGIANVRVVVSGEALQLGELRDVHVLPNGRTAISETQAFLREGAIDIPMPPAGTEARDWRYSVTPSTIRMALDALPSLAGALRMTTTDAASLLGALGSLSDALDSMRYGRQWIGTRMDASPHGHGFDQRIERAATVLLEAQNPDGGWGWIKGAASDDFISGYIVFMFGNAPVGAEGEQMLEAARAHVADRLLGAGQPDEARAWLLMALASRHMGGGRPSRAEARALATLIRSGDSLSGFSLACLIQAASYYKLQDEARKLVPILLAKAQRAGASNSAVLRWVPGQWARDAGITPTGTTALALMALIAADPDRADTAPLVRYLVINSHDSHWTGSRETALAIVTLSRLAAMSAEVDTRADVRLRAGTTLTGNVAILPGKALEGPEWQTLPAGEFQPGDLLHVEAGPGSSQVSVRVQCTHEAWPVAGTDARGTVPGLDLTREYLVSKQVPTLLRGLVEEIVVAEPTTNVLVGDRVEALLTLTVNQPLQRVIIEDHRPGCLDYVRRTGPVTAALVNVNTGEAVPVAVQRRPGTIAFYVDSLPVGTWTVRYMMRVESSGIFQAPPATAWLSPDPATISTSERSAFTAEEP